jgi:hypothetical protein
MMEGRPLRSVDLVVQIYLRKVNIIWYMNHI